MTDSTAAPRAMPPVTVEVITDGYRLSCPELSVACVAPTIEIGYATLREVAANAAKAGVGFIPLASATAEGSSRPHALQAGRKSSSIALLVIAGLLLPVVVVTVSALNEVRNVLGSIRQLTSSPAAVGDQTQQIARSGSVALERLADTLDNLTPERQQEMRHNLQRISIKLAPAAEGLRPLFVATGLAEPQQNDAPPSRSDGN